MEEWKRSTKYTEYEISNKGRVRNMLTGRVLKNSINKNGGYEQVCLRREGKSKTERIRNLVADTFLEHKEGMDVRNKNGDILDSRAENLEYCNRSKTIKSAYDRGSKVPNNMVKVRVVETGETYDSVTECAHALNVLPSGVSKCINRAAYTCNGYHFEKIN